MTGFQGRNPFIVSQASGGDGGIAWPAVKMHVAGFGSHKMHFFDKFYDLDCQKILDCFHINMNCFFNL